jgi:hypothetical protein
VRASRPDRRRSSMSSRGAPLCDVAIPERPSRRGKPPLLANDGGCGTHAATRYLPTCARRVYFFLSRRTIFSQGAESM